MNQFLPLSIYLIFGLMVRNSYPSLFDVIGAYTYDCLNLSSVTQGPHQEKNLSLIVILIAISSLVHFLKISYYQIKFKEKVGELVKEYDKELLKKDIKKISASLLISFLGSWVLIASFMSHEKIIIDSLLSFISVQIICYLISGSIIDQTRYIPLLTLLFTKHRR